MEGNPPFYNTHMKHLDSPVSHAFSSQAVVELPADLQDQSAKPSLRLRDLDKLRVLISFVAIWYATYLYAHGGAIPLTTGGIVAHLVGCISNIFSFFFVVTGLLNFLPIVRSCLLQDNVISGSSFFLRRLV